MFWQSILQTPASSGPVSMFQVSGDSVAGKWKAILTQIFWRFMNLEESDTHTNTLGRRLPKRKEGRKWSLPVSLLSDLIPPRGRKKRRDPLETRCSLMGWHTFPFYSLDFSRVPRPFSTEPFPICQYLLVFFVLLMVSRLHFKAEK